MGRAGPFDRGARHERAELPHPRFDFWKFRHLGGYAPVVADPISVVVTRGGVVEAVHYRLPAHPLQRAMVSEVAAAAEVDEASLPTATDGCGVVTFALPLDRCARLFGRLPRLEGGDRVVRAMRARPELLRGPVAADALVITTLDGWVAKGGAEGLFCACSPDGLGIALKVEDGAFRAVRPAVAAFLGSLGLETGSLGIVTVDNSRGEPVGEVIARH